MSAPSPLLRRAAPSLALALLASGCDGLGGTTGGGIGVAPPAPLLQSRAVVVERLRPVVTIDGGAEIAMRPNADGSRWRGTVSVPPNRDYAIRIVWTEEVVDGERTRDLPLASLESTVSVGPEGGAFVLESSDPYRFDLDFDEDGETNFDERERGSDPFRSTGVPVPIADPPTSERTDTPAEDEPSGPDAPAEPTGPAGPERPEDPVEPTEPIESERPEEGDETTEPVESERPEEPAEPAEPVESERPEEPVEPTEPDAPAESGRPDTPAETDEPAEPDETERPDAPTEPDEPETEAPTPVDLVVPRIAAADAPVLDGRGVSFAGDGFGGEWAAATTLDASGRRLFIDRLMIDQGTDESDGQAFRAWGAMHDGTWLYVLVVVEDDGFRVRDDAPEELWQDDSLEVYVDGDNSKRSTYGDGDDSQRLIPLLAPGTDRTGTREGLVPGYRSVDTPIRIEFATGPGVGPDGIRRPRYEQDVYELRIDLASANIEIGRPFGFELQVNDDDDGGAREAKWGWAHPSRVDVDVDETFENPSFMGTAILE